MHTLKEQYFHIIVCYPGFCTSLLSYILEDEQRVRELEGYSHTLCNIPLTL